MKKEKTLNTTSSDQFPRDQLKTADPIIKTRKRPYEAYDTSGKPAPYTEIRSLMQPSQSPQSRFFMATVFSADDGDFCPESSSAYPNRTHGVAESRFTQATSLRLLDHPSLDPALGIHHEGISHQEEGDFYTEHRPDCLSPLDEPLKSRKSRPSITPGIHDGSDAGDALLAEATFLWTRLYTEEQRQPAEGSSLIWGFITRLQEHSEQVRATMINILMQHSFLGRYSPHTAGGARWFYRSYARYVTGDLPLTPEIESCLQTDASYTQIEVLPAVEHLQQQRQWRDPIFPLTSCLTEGVAGDIDESHEEPVVKETVVRQTQYQRQYSNDTNHRRLVILLNQANVFVALSYYPHPLVNELYPAEKGRWVMWRTSRCVARSDTTRLKATESQLMNYSAQHMSHMATNQWRYWEGRYVSHW